MGFESIQSLADATSNTHDNLSGYERGKSLVPPLYVQRLKTLFGVSHDWIYGNDLSCMRPDLAVKIEKTPITD